MIISTGPVLLTISGFRIITAARGVPTFRERNGPFVANTIMITGLCSAWTANYRECGQIRVGLEGPFKHVKLLVPQQSTALILVSSSQKGRLRPTRGCNPLGLRPRSVVSRFPFPVSLRPRPFVRLILMTTTTNCLGWMQNQNDQSPCTTAQEVGQLCNSGCKRNFSRSSVIRTR